MNDDLILIDTSAWIEFFRRDKSVSITGIEVERLLSQDLVVTTEPVLVELAAGAKSKKSLNELKEMFSSFHTARVTEQVWSETTENIFSLGSRGYTVPLSDVVIATVSMAYRLPLLHQDKHFKSIASVLQLEEHQL